jgi:hypothetical protein
MVFRTLGAELAGHLGIGRRIGVGANLQLSESVDPAHNRAKIAGQLGRNGGNIAENMYFAALLSSSVFAFCPSPGKCCRGTATFFRL